MEGEFPFLQPGDGRVIINTKGKESVGKTSLTLNVSAQPRPPKHLLLRIKLSCVFWNIFPSTTKTDTDLSHGDTVGINYNTVYVECLPPYGDLDLKSCSCLRTTNTACYYVT